jgi:hypothetical protein
MANADIERDLQALLGARRPSRWVTRERPKIDRIACPSAIRRLIDPEAEILYAPTARVFEVEKENGAIAFDIPGARISYEGERCSFDMLLAGFGLKDPALQRVAVIVRGADTDRPRLAPEAAGLHAISLGPSHNFPDDQEMLKAGIIVYDALNAWAKSASGERHAWTPGAA